MSDKIASLVKLIEEPRGSIVLTGEFSCCDRMESINIFEVMGLRVSGSVYSKTKFLLVGDGYMQEKIDRALSMGIPVFTESEFWNAVDVVFPPNKN